MGTVSLAAIAKRVASGDGPEAGLGWSQHQRLDCRARRRPARERPAERQHALAVGGTALGLRREIEDRAGLADVERLHLGGTVAAEERTHVLDERRVVDPEQAPLGDGERLPVSARKLVERLEIGPRRVVGQAFVVDVAAVDVHVRAARVVRLRGVSGHAGRAAGQRTPEDAEARKGVEGEIAAAQGRLPERAQLDIDLGLCPAVEDHVDSRESCAVPGRRVRGVLRPAVRPVGRVDVGRIVHLGHRPDVDALTPGGDRRVERHQIGVALTGGDARRRDRLPPVAAARAEVDHRDRAERGKERRELRAVRISLSPADEGLDDLGLLTRLALEARGIPAHSEQQAGRGRGAGPTFSRGRDTEHDRRRQSEDAGGQHGVAHPGILRPEWLASKQTPGCVQRR
jgi:hypothetical protein